MILWAADSHVHFHKCFDEGLFFDNSFQNLSKSASSTIKQGILFFTESKNEDYFSIFQTKSKIKSTLNKEVCYLIAANCSENVIEVKWDDEEKKIFIVSGFQIVTKENLEVLSLGTAKRVKDGSSIEDTIAAVKSLGGIPVLPWGFGKWFGNRGKKIDELINKRIPDLFLGDNGGRTDLLPFPVQFEDAEANGLKVLPGSDPLPFKGEVRRPLSYGFTFNANIDESDPWSGIKNTFLDPKFYFENFGKLTSPINFIKTQIAMQIKKRKSR